MVANRLVGRRVRLLLTCEPEPRPRPLPSEHSSQSGSTVAVPADGIATIGCFASARA